jgi:hypothetical protein
MTLRNLIVIFLLSVTVSSVRAGGEPRDEVHKAAPEKFKNLFVFKTDKKFIGATVDILSVEGDLITSQKLQKRKMIIDFRDVQLGTYIIRVSKGNQIKEFQYTKN